MRSCQVRRRYYNRVSLRWDLYQKKEKNTDKKIFRQTRELDQRDGTRINTQSK